jgi:membrane carboxypeptidase/penicillin-binding protein PbpC
VADTRSATRHTLLSDRSALLPASTRRVDREPRSARVSHGRRGSRKAGSRSDEHSAAAPGVPYVSHALRRSAPQEVIALEASAAGDVQQVSWFDGSALIGVRPLAEGALPWRPTVSGMHLIRIVDDHGRSAERDVEVRFTQ